MATDSLSQQHSTAMSEHLQPRSAAVVIHDSDDRPVEVGSGTCVQIADRYFVATCAHILDNVTTLREVGVMAFGRPGEFSRQTPKIVGSGRRGGERSDPVDVAWLELMPKAIPAWLETWGRVFVTLDRVRVEAVATGAHTYVFGQPARYLRQSSFQGTPFLGLKPLRFLTVAIETPTNAHAQDLYIAYPLEMHSADGVIQVPEAPGLSGSGMWVVNPRSDGVWTPDAATLVAIQRSWHEGERWLRGTLIRHWLEMVREDIPELAPEIDAVLGRQNEDR